MIIAFISPRDLAICAEVALIVGGVWTANFVRLAMRDIQRAGDWPIEEDGCSSVPHRRADGD
jgi:hypothetical protein